MSQKIEPKEQLEEVDERERAFWNEMLDSDAAKLKMTDAYVGLSPYGLCQIELLGSLNGKKVLELGCGSGDWAIRLALLGAEVFAIDVSDEAVTLTLRRAAICNVADKVKAQRMSVYAMDFDTASFDFIHGTNILHHLNCARAGLELRRVLRPVVGKAIFQGNSSRNPLLMLGRKLCGHFGIPKWSSDDEYPLRKSDIKAIKSPFKGARSYYPEFQFFFYINVKFFGYRNKRVSRICTSLDNFIFKFLPFLRSYSYHQILELYT